MTDRSRFDKYGGVIGGRNFVPSGFFRTVYDEVLDRTIFITPDGNPYFMLGMNTVTPWFHNYKINGFEKVYGGDTIKWGRVAIDRCWGWGFNCLTYKTAPLLIRHMIAGKVPRMPYAPVLEFIENNALVREDFPDVWSDEWYNHCDAHAASQCAVVKNDPWCMGYFLGNEMFFDLRDDARWRSQWLRMLMMQDQGTPAIKVFQQTLAKKYNSIAAFNNAYNVHYQNFGLVDVTLVGAAYLRGHPPAQEDVRMFNALLARRFYISTISAIIRHDPNHLMLGSRFPTTAEREVLQALNGVGGAMSLNHYAKQVGRVQEETERVNRHTHLPVIHSEIGWLIEGRNLPYPGVPTQRDRGEYWHDFLLNEITWPFIVGMCWYGYMDGGWVGHGTDAVMNFGLIDIHDDPYTEAVEWVTKGNRAAMKVFAKLFRQKK